MHKNVRVATQTKIISRKKIVNDKICQTKPSVNLYKLIWPSPKIKMTHKYHFSRPQETKLNCCDGGVAIDKIDLTN